MRWTPLLPQSSNPDLIFVSRYHFWLNGRPRLKSIPRRLYLWRASDDEAFVTLQGSLKSPRLIRYDQEFTDVSSYQCIYIDSVFPIDCSKWDDDYVDMLA